MDEKVFSKKEVFHIAVDILCNIIGDLSLQGNPKSMLLPFLDRITIISNGTLVHQYGYTSEDIKEYAADGLLGLHTFTAHDKEN